MGWVALFVLLAAACASGSNIFSQMLRGPPDSEPTHLLHDQAVADGALLALVRGSVVEVVGLALVALVAHEARAAVTGAVAAALHGDGAHRVAVARWGRWAGERWGEETGNRSAKFCHLKMIISLLGFCITDL